MGQGHDGGGLQLTSDGAHSLADAVGNGVLAVPREAGLGVVLLNAPGNGGHDLHSFHRVLPHGGLVGEHHRVGAIQNGIGHVTHLRPGGTGIGGHAVQHLGGGDDGDSQAVGLADQLFLQQRHILRGDFHPQITPGHHHAIAKGQDLVNAADGLELLDLGHHRGAVAMAADQLPDRHHVFGIAHKAQSNPIHPLLQSKAQITAVFFCQGTDGELHIREVDPLVVGEHSAHHHLTVEGLRLKVRSSNPHFHLAVIQQNARSRRHFFRQGVVGDLGNALITGHGPGGELKAIPLDQTNGAVLKATQANLGALQIRKDANVLAHLMGHLADGGHPQGMIGMTTVGKIQPKRGGSSPDQLLNALGAIRCRTNGGNNFCAPIDVLPALAIETSLRCSHLSNDVSCIARVCKQWTGNAA